MVHTSVCEHYICFCTNGSKWNSSESGCSSLLDAAVLSAEKLTFLVTLTLLCCSSDVPADLPAGWVDSQGWTGSQCGLTATLPSVTGSRLCRYLSRCSCSAAGQCLTALLGWRRIKDRVLNRRFGLFVWRRLWRGRCSWFSSRLMLTCLPLGVNTPQSSLFPSRGAAQTRMGESLLWFHILVINWTCMLKKAEVSSYFLFFLPLLYTANALSALVSLWLHISSLCPPASNLSLAPNLQSLLVQWRILVFFWKIQLSSLFTYL